MATQSIQGAQAHAALVGQVVEGVLGILKAPEEKLACHCTFSELMRAFKAAAGLPKSLFVVRVENDYSEQSQDASERLAQQAQITQQLASACGRSAHVAAIGDKEYAVLLIGIAQCSELIPRLKNLLSRTIAGHLNGDGTSLDCRVGVARSPMDSEDLTELICMASNAATELGVSDLRYQFISRRHRTG